MHNALVTHGTPCSENDLTKSASASETTRTTDNTTDHEDARRTITRVVTKEGTYVCGTRGLLMRLTGGEHFVYKTNTNNDVSDIMTFMCNKLEVLIATAKEDVLIYNPVETAPRCVLNVPGIRRLVSNGSQIFIILNDCSMKTLDLHRNDTRDAKIGVCEYMENIFPTERFPSVALFSKASESLYKAFRGNDYETVDIVEGVMRVKDVIAGLNGKIICYSDNTMWLLGKKFKVDDSFVFDCGIKFVERLKNQLIVVVDGDNTVHLFKRTEDCKLSLHHKRTLEEDITAVAISKSKVFVGVDNRLLAYDYTQDGVQGLKTMMELDGGGAA